jgi:hypothetical protein
LMEGSNFAECFARLTQTVSRSAKHPLARDK